MNKNLRAKIVLCVALAGFIAMIGEAFASMYPYARFISYIIIAVVCVAILAKKEKRLPATE